MYQSPAPVLDGPLARNARRRSTPRGRDAARSPKTDEHFDGLIETLAEFQRRWLDAEHRGGCPREKRWLAIRSGWLWEMIRIQCRRWSRHRDVDDLVPSVMIAICEKIDRAKVVYDPKRRGSFRGWWVVIIQNVMRKMLPKTRRVMQERLEEEIADDRAGIPDVLVDELVSAVERLPKRQRDAITFRFLDGMSYREIARRARVCVRTVRRDICLGLATLRVAFGVA